MVDNPDEAGEEFDDVEVFQGKMAGKTNRSDEDRVMDDITRRKRKTFDWVKIIFGHIFSHFGIMILCILYANIGTRNFMKITRKTTFSKME